MKQYTTSDQTAKLIELGIEKPKSIEKMIPQPVVDGYVHLVPQKAYSIGELIEILNSVGELEITRYGSGWGVYDELRAFTGEELIDALYDMMVKLKEEGVI